MADSRKSVHAKYLEKADSRKLVLADCDFLDLAKINPLKVLLKWQCGFCKGFSTQHCFLVMTEKWRKCLDKKGISRAILTDLPKTFDCILHDLLIAKLAAYGFDYQSLRILESFLSNRQQRTKINNAFSRYSEIIYGVPQASILGPLLFNICDIFFGHNRM